MSIHETSTSKRGVKAPSPAFVRATIEELRKRAASGDREAAARLEQWLDGYPEYRQELSDLVDLTQRVRQAWIAAAVGSDPVAVSRVKDEMDAMRGQLLSPDAGPLEKALVENVVLNDLALKRAMLLVVKPSPDLATQQMRDRHLTQAQKRFLSAARAWDLYSQKHQELVKWAAKATSRAATPIPPRRPRRHSARVRCR